LNWGRPESDSLGFERVGCSWPLDHIFTSRLGALCNYIHRELVFKNVFPRSSLPSYLEDWLTERYSHCVYTLMQLATFPRVHLVTGGWYLDCSRGFVPEAEEALYSSLVSSAPEVIELEEEPEEDENPAPPPIVKEVGSV
jgi:hypothetical protein